MQLHLKNLKLPALTGESGRVTQK